MTPASPHPARTPDLVGDRGSYRATNRAETGDDSVVAPLLLGFLLAVALIIMLAGPDRVGQVASDLFASYVAAQQKMLQASGNTTADGRAEFAVLLRDSEHAPAFRDAVRLMDTVTFEREANLPGWMIVTTDAGNRAGLDALLALPESRVVMPNRGLWLCH